MNTASNCSLSENVELPPGRRAVKRISSFRKSVGLSSTRIPFDNVHSVIPLSGSARDDTTRPGVGTLGTSGLSLVESTNATNGARFTLSNAASNSARVGSVTSARSDAETMTTRLRGGVQSRAARLTSSTEMLASTCVAIVCTVFTDGLGPSLRKLATYCCANPPDCALSISVTCRSSERRTFTRARSSSVAVNPKRVTRSISCRMASSDAVNARPLTIANAFIASRVGTKPPRPTPAN